MNARRTVTGARSWAKTGVERSSPAANSPRNMGSSLYSYGLQGRRITDGNVSGAARLASVAQGAVGGRALGRPEARAHTRHAQDAEGAEQGADVHQGARRRYPGGDQ